MADKERSTWQVLRELADPTYVPEAQAWTLKPLLKVLPKAEDTRMWQKVKDVAELLATKGGQNFREGGYLGQGAFGKVYLYKPESYAPIVLKIGHKDLLKPDLAYSEHIKGIPPVLKEFDLGRSIKAIAMPFIPGQHPQHRSPSFLSAAMPGGPDSLDVINIMTEAANKGLDVTDAHARNLIRAGSHPQGGWYSEPNISRTWMIDRGGVWPNIYGGDATRRYITSEMVHLMDHPFHQKEAEVLKSLLQRPEASTRWPELYDLLLQDRWTRRYLGKD